MKIFPGIPVVAVALFTLACNRKGGGAVPLFELQQNTGIDFVNKVEDGNLDNSFLFRNFYNGGGVAIGDINNDGLPDILLTSNMGENKLYLNKGNFHFEDITATSGLHQDSMWSTGVTFVDINGDGWLDIYICNSGHMASGHRKNQLYINNHDNTFTEAAAKYGLDISAYSTQVTFFDYDGDGDLDCFMIDNSPIPINTLNNANRRDLPEAQWPVADFLKGGGDHLYRNDNGHFTEVTRQAGIHGSPHQLRPGRVWSAISMVTAGPISMCPTIPTNAITSTSTRRTAPSKTSSKTISAISACLPWAPTWPISTTTASPDLFTTDMLPDNDYRLKTLGSFDNIFLYNAKLKAGFYHQYMKNCLQLNTASGKFIDIADYSGVSATDWSWGALMFDMDNDGLTDIFVCNGVNKDVTNLDFMDFFANDVVQKMALTGKKDEYPGYPQ